MRARREVWVIRDVRGAEEGCWGVERRWAVQWRKRLV